MSEIQMSIFDFIQPTYDTSDLEKLPEDDMVILIRNATGINFQYRDELFGYEATINKWQYRVRYGRYSGNNERYITCECCDKISGWSGPQDTVDHAIEFFQKALARNGRK